MNYLNRLLYKVKSLFGSPPDEACIPSHVQANDAISRKRPRDDADDDLAVATDSPPKRTRMLDNILREAEMNRRNVNMSTSGTQTYGNLLLPCRPKLFGSDKTVDSWTTVIEDEETMSPSKFKNKYKAPMHVRSPNKRTRTNLPTQSKRNGSVTGELSSPANTKSRTTMIASRGIFDTHRRSPRSQLFKRVNPAMSREEYQHLLCSVLSESAKQVMRKPSAQISTETIDLTKDDAIDFNTSLLRRRSRSVGMKTFSTPVVHPSVVTNETIDLTSPPQQRPSRFVGLKSSSTPVVHPNVINVDDELTINDRENVTPRRVVPRLNSFEEKIKQNVYTDPNLSIVRNFKYERYLQSSLDLAKQYHERSRVERQISNATIEELISSRLQSHLKITESLLAEEEEKEVETVKPELTKEMMAQINNAWHERLSPREVLVSKFKLDVTRADLLTLKNLNWLNDAVINFYMELIVERGGTAPDYPQIYAFSTFFYPTLGKGYDRVRRYTRKVDLFSKDLILVPIHLAVHWCMAKIDLTKKKIYYYDSMRASNQRALEILLDYLVQEHRDKKKEEFDTDGWELINDKDIPCQKNGSDCGVFACTFGEYSSRKSKFNFSQNDMPYMRQKMVYEILSGRLLL